METPIKNVKRNHKELSPDGRLSPPIKLQIIRRSPKERRVEISEIVEELINPVKRELETTKLKLQEAEVKL